MVIQVTPTSRNTFSHGCAEMIVLHRGFDRLELGYKQKISQGMFERLKARRQIAEDSGEDIDFETARFEFWLSPCGVRGGYQFELKLAEVDVSVQLAGPTSRTYHGVKVILGARGLATRGIEAMLEILNDVFTDLNLPIRGSAASILRLDICTDILAPDLHPEQYQFVLHSQSTKDSYSTYDNSIAERARGNVTETITIGRTPGRQVTIYNKSLEVQRNPQPYVLSIWSARLRELGRSLRDFDDLKSFNVWRIELRAGSRYLKENSDIAGLSDLFVELPNFVSKALEQVKLTVPSPRDRNRHRWPNHPIWDLARAELLECLSGPLTKVAGHGQEAHFLERKKQFLLRQILGCTASLMVMDGTTPPDVSDFLSRQSAWLKQEFEKNPSKLHPRAKKDRRTPYK